MWKKKEKPVLVIRRIELIKQIELAYETKTVETPHVCYGECIYTGEKTEKFYVQVKNIWSDGSESIINKSLTAKDEESANLIFDVLVEQKGDAYDSIVIKETSVTIDKKIEKWE